MSANLQNRIFQDEALAREWLEARVWPNGPVCPHCGATNHDVTKLTGAKHRPGLYQCNECREQFTVTVKTVFERSKIPLTKWLAALFLMTASKKGVSAHQIHRSLDISYKSAWFMCHRLREAMRSGGLASMGGANEIVEVAETFIGKLEGAPKRAHPGSPWRNVVLTLVTRSGNARSFHSNATSVAAPLPIIHANIQAETYVMTDEATWHRSLGDTFDNHDTINHSQDEYGRRDWTWHGGKLHTVQVHTNTLKATSPFSNAACAASISTAKRSTCTATWRNSISATTRAPRWATPICNAPNWRRLASGASGSRIGDLTNPIISRRVKRPLGNVLSEWSRTLKKD